MAKSPRGTFARGEYAIGECGRGGHKMRLKDMVPDGRYPWLMVDPEWKEDPHPQERLLPPVDPVALRHPAPEQILSPTTPVLVATGGGHSFSDDFNRADGALTSPWSVFGAQTPAIIVANQLGFATGGAKYSNLTPPFAASTTQRVSYVFYRTGASSDLVQVWLRAFGTAGSDLGSAYRTSLFWTSAIGWRFVVDAYASGAVTSLLTANIPPVADGALIEHAIVGATITFSVNGIVVMSYTDPLNRFPSAAAYLPIGFGGNGASNPQRAIDNLLVHDGPIISWSASIHPASQIESYDIYRAVDGGGLVLHDELELERGELGAIITPLEYTDISADLVVHDYTYQVVAVPESGPRSAPSNTVTITS